MEELKVELSKIRIIIRIRTINLFDTYLTVPRLCSPEDEALEDLVGDAEACVPENQPQVEAGGLPRVVPVILQERGLGRTQSVLYWSFKKTVGKSIIVGLKIELETNVHEVFNPRLLAPKIGRLMGSMG